MKSRRLREIHVSSFGGLLFSTSVHPLADFIAQINAQYILKIMGGYCYHNHHLVLAMFYLENGQPRHRSNQNHKHIDMWIQALNTACPS